MSDLAARGMIDEADIEAIADRVVEKLEARDRRGGGLIDARKLAAMLSVKRGWVYDHAEQLGAKRIGSGQRPRLRFDAEQAVRAAAALGADLENAPADAAVTLYDNPPQPPRRCRPRKKKAPSGIDLIQGRRP